METRCTQSSASVEVHTFYGSKDTVKEKSSTCQRTFLNVGYSSKLLRAAGRTAPRRADVKLFEKQKDGSLPITQWTKATAPDLFDKLDDAIIKNKGYNCVGEAMKDVLTKTFGKQGESLTPLSTPTSTEDAFGPSVQDASGDFFKTIVIFGC